MGTMFRELYNERGLHRSAFSRTIPADVRQAD